MSPDLDDTDRNGQVHDWGSWTVVMDDQRSSSKSKGSPIVWLDVVNVQRPTKPFTHIMRIMRIFIIPLCECRIKVPSRFLCATSSSSATMLLVDPGLCSWVCLGDLGANPTHCSQKYLLLSTLPREPLARFLEILTSISDTQKKKKTKTKCFPVHIIPSPQSESEGRKAAKSESGANIVVRNMIERGGNGNGNL